MHNFSPYKNSFRPSQGFPKVHEGTAGGLWVDEKLIIDLNFKINIIINTKKKHLLQTTKYLIYLAACHLTIKYHYELWTLWTLHHYEHASIMLNYWNINLKRLYFTLTKKFGNTWLLISFRITCFIVHNHTVDYKTTVYKIYYYLLDNHKLPKDMKMYFITWRNDCFFGLLL